MVHLSVGSFHRSHQAVYFDELARHGLSERWGVTGVGLYRRGLKDALVAQDGLYTLVTRSGDGDAGRVIGAMTRYVFAPDDRATALHALVDERTQLVTLTITADGYKIRPDSGMFAEDDPEIVHDLAEPGEPHSALGLLVEALDRRRRAGRRPFTVLSCDNVPDNGSMARSSVLGLASRRDACLTRWIDRHVTFPSCMVDRITPRPTAEDRDTVEQLFGVRDRCPIITEPFSQWVIEDAFCNARPPLDLVGARFVDDVRPYALAKTRLLNASHSALGYLATLAGHRRTDEAMADVVFAEYVERMMNVEISPLLPRVGLDLVAYAALLRARFANPAIADKLSRLCRNGSAKVPAHLLSSIRDARAVGRPHGLLTLAVSGWCRYLRGVDEFGNRVLLDDGRANHLQRLALAGGGDPALLLHDGDVFGSLGTCPQFVDAVRRDLADLDAHGARSVIARRLAHDEQMATV